MSDRASDERRADQATARVGYWVLGLFGSVVLALADVLARIGNLDYTNESLNTDLHVVAFAGVLVFAVVGFVGVAIARSRPVISVWLLRAAALVAVIASVYAMAKAHPIAGFGLLIFAGLPLLVAASFVRWAEQPTA
jgi:hypothetical protein